MSEVAAAMGLGAAVQRAGTTIVAAEDRSGSSMVVAYSIAAHTVLWCDPALVDDLSPLVSGATAIGFDEIDAWGGAIGWDRISCGRMQLLRPSGVAPSPDPSIVTRSLDRDSPQDVALIDAFKATLSDDDRDEAELDGDDLDEHIVVAIDDQGITAFSSQRPFRYADGFGDIAVATRADVRGRGVGRTAVGALSEEIERRDLFALYRCDEANLGSVRLSAAVGFVPVVRVLAYKRP